VNQVTSASLRYPLSVFNKNSTLKEGKKEGKRKPTTSTRQTGGKLEKKAINPD